MKWTSTNETTYLLLFFKMLSVHNLRLLFKPINYHLILQNLIYHNNISQNLSFKICSKAEKGAFEQTKILGFILFKHNEQNENW